MKHRNARASFLAAALWLVAGAFALVPAANAQARTPLQTAASRCDEAAVMILQTRTPLQTAASRCDEAAVMILIEAGADVMVRDDDGNTLLHLAARPNPSYGDHDCATEVVRMLIEAGVDPNAKDSGGRTPLHSATEAGNAEMMQVLIKAGADPNPADKGG